MPIILISFCLLLSSCATSAIHLSDAKEGWFDVRGYKGNSVYYCTNKKNSESAKIDPICYEADVLDRREK